MTLPYSTDFPKPGATLTAAQANALPVGSEIRNPSGIIYTKSATMGWLRKNNGDPIHNGPNVNCDHWATLIRVGPAVASPANPPATDFLHIDPAAITAELDQAIPQWREESWTVAQAIRVLRQRYEMQMQVCMYQGDSAAASAKYTKRLEEQVATLTAERDAAISEIGKSCAIMAKSHAEEVKGLTTERDAALQRAEKAEAAEREWMAKGSQIDADMDDLREERDDALAFARTMEVACKELRSRLIVPEGVRDWAKGIDFVNVPVHVLASVKCFILSLADHIVDATPQVQSTHPEGSREWAEDAMRQGFSVTHQYADDVCWKDFACTDGRKWKGRGMADTGWRIHTPAVAPSADPSVVQLAASIEAHEKRILALEAGQ